MCVFLVCTQHQELHKQLDAAIGSTFDADAEKIAAQLEAHFDGVLANAAELEKSAAGRMKEIEAEIAATELALDEVYSLLQPGAERRAPKRTRAACRQIVELRLRAVRELLDDAPRRAAMAAALRAAAEGHSWLARAMRLLDWMEARA